MEELYLLDENLKKIHIIDTYSSAIWSPRYNTLGDCELVIQASKENDFMKSLQRRASKGDC